MKLLDALKSLGMYLASRKRQQPVTTIVLHATAGSSFVGAWVTLRAKGYSYHSLVCDENDGHGDGSVIKCVPDSRVAFHAGKSVGPSGSNANGYSLGLSLVNNNDGHDPYSDAQQDAVADRCWQWIQAYPTITYITTHYAISPGRKTDPRGYPVRALVIEMNRRLHAAGSTRRIIGWRV